MSADIPTSDRVNIKSVEVLADDYYVLKKTTLEYQRNDGEWQTFSRETYDRGNGATLLPYNRKTGNIVLIKQFRFPVFVNGHDGMLIEACAGLLDERDPVTCIRAEAEEETGLSIENVVPVLEIFMSPGSVTERLHFFIAEYCESDKTSAGGGVLMEGEDIEVFEIHIDKALAMIDSGEIADAKTIILIQHLRLKGLI